MDKFYVIVYETKVTTIDIKRRANWIHKLYPEAEILYGINPPNQYGLDEESVKIQTDYLKKILKEIPVTHFYNSEPYGKFVARDLKIEEVQVDRKRKKYPISASKIRKNIEKNENYMENIVYQEVRQWGQS